MLFIPVVGHSQFDLYFLISRQPSSPTNKIDELSIIMQINYIGPQFICFTEHHLKEYEIKKFSLEGYTLAPGFCRKASLGGGVCILINKSLEYQPIDLSQFCYEKTL
jgi:hypothetical protein